MQEYRMLIVDDNLMALKLLNQHLRAMGFTRIKNATGAAAASDRLEEANTAGEPFHLMLLDWHMPGIDGSRFLTE